MQRTIVRAEALAWLDANPAALHTSVITSLPDVSELPRLNIDSWQAFFVDAARRVIRWVPDTGVAIFFQSDIRRQGRWIDKSYLVMRALEEERAQLVWHKIVCRQPAGTVSYGRASYSHMLCVSRTPRKPPRLPSADVIPDAGFMPWSRAMGETACRVACQFLRDETETREVVDPFCGHGTALAVANDFGFDAVGIDLSARCCRVAAKLRLGRAESL